jgi:hypothetical protein
MPSQGGVGWAEIGHLYDPTNDPVTGLFLQARCGEPPHRAGRIIAIALAGCRARRDHGGQRISRKSMPST